MPDTPKSRQDSELRSESRMDDSAVTADIRGAVVAAGFVVVAAAAVDGARESGVSVPAARGVLGGSASFAVCAKDSERMGGATAEANRLARADVGSVQTCEREVTGRDKMKGTTERRSGK